MYLKNDGRKVIKDKKITDQRNMFLLLPRLDVIEGRCGVFRKRWKPKHISLINDVMFLIILYSSPLGRSGLVVTCLTVM